MIKSNNIIYSNEYKKIVNTDRSSKNFDNSFGKIGKDFLTQTKNKYIPVRTGFLRRSTILQRPAKRTINLISTATYAAFVWDNAVDFWRRHWFEKVANAKRNMTIWGNIILKEYFL